MFLIILRLFPFFFQKYIRRDAAIFFAAFLFPILSNPNFVDYDNAHRIICFSVNVVLMKTILLFLIFVKRNKYVI